MACQRSMDAVAHGPEPAARRTSGVRAARGARQPGARGIPEGRVASLATLPVSLFSRRMVVHAACIAVWCAAAWPGSPATEYQVKAAYLFNFGQFVDWPAAAYPSPNAP